MQPQSKWPNGVSTAEGVHIDTNGAMCVNCGDLMEDHRCPSSEETERVRTYKKPGNEGKKDGVLIPFPKEL